MLKATHKPWCRARLRKLRDLGSQWWQPVCQELQDILGESGQKSWGKSHGGCQGGSGEEGSGMWAGEQRNLPQGASRR